MLDHGGNNEESGKWPLIIVGVLVQDLLIQGLVWLKWSVQVAEQT